MAAFDMPGAQKLCASPFGMTVAFAMLLGIKKVGDVAAQAVGVQTTKITGEAVPLIGDPPIPAT